MQNMKKTVTGLIKEYSLSQSEKIAFVVKDETITYKELYRRINIAAKYLQDNGVQKGNHVLTVANPNISYVVNMYAILGIGAVHIPVENNIPENRVCEIASRIDADFFISSEKPGFNVNWIDISQIEKESTFDENWIPCPVSDDCSEIIFTTGTTGKSKGVMLSSHCLDVYIDAMSPSFNLLPESVFLVNTPLNHVGGLHRIHQSMAAGSTVVLMDGMRDLKGFFDALEKYNVTHCYLPPASVKLILAFGKKKFAQFDGKIKFIYTASAPFPMKDIETLMSIMPNTHLHQGYGSSETGSISNCWYNAPGSTVDCLGKPYDCVDIKLIDEDGNEIKEANKAGRIISKSGMNMLGYYKEPELTEKVLRNGYIYSNDLMFFDENNQLHFAGRNDDVINMKGFKIAPTEIETIVLQNEYIEDCVCIPYEDPFQGVVLKLLVKLSETNSLDVEKLTKYIAERVEPYKVPKIVNEVKEIERTFNGKLNRKKMIELYSGK